MKNLQIAKRAEEFKFGRGVIFISVTPDRAPSIQAGYDELLNAGMISAKEHADWTRALQERGVASLGYCKGLTMVAETG